jgi:hypothetical protein
MGGKSSLDAAITLMHVFVPKNSMFLKSGVYRRFLMQTRAEKPLEDTRIGGILRL